MSSPPETPPPQEAPGEFRVFPKLKAWEASVYKVISKFDSGRLHAVLLSTMVYMKAFEKGAYAVNIGHVPMRARNWLYRRLTNGSQTLTMSSSVRNGLHNVGSHFASVSETRYCFGSFNWWLMRRQRKQMLKVSSEDLATHLRKATEAYYKGQVPMEMLACLRLLENLYRDCPVLYWLMLPDGSYDVLGQFSNEAGDYATFWAAVDPSQLLPENLART